ncbi:hypothetical protein GR7B_00114 [Vibrio phage vB_VcorM_GR7B]|nr:hypothetical protein GR7B_00114 [Vibrio phage vB_VcorM_GR7B]
MKSLLNPLFDMVKKLDFTGKRVTTANYLSSPGRYVRGDYFIPLLSDYLAQFPTTLIYNNGLSDCVVHFAQFGGVSTIPDFPTIYQQRLAPYTVHSGDPIIYESQQMISGWSSGSPLYNLRPMEPADFITLQGLRDEATYPSIPFAQTKLVPMLTSHISHVAHVEKDDGMFTLFFANLSDEDQSNFVLAGYKLSRPIYDTQEWVDIWQGLDSREYVDFMMPLGNAEVNERSEPQNMPKLRLRKQYDYIAQARLLVEDGINCDKIVHLRIEEGSGGTSATRYNCNTSEGIADVQLVTIPQVNMHQLRELFPDIEPSELPNCVDFDDPEFIELMERVGDYERGQYFSTLGYNEEIVPPLLDYLTHFHTQDARALERNRVFGHKCAEAIGFNVPASIVVKSLEDWHAKKDRIPTDKIAVKYLKTHFIDIFDKDGFELTLPNLLNGGALFIEQYLGRGDNEFNVSFLINEDHVQPMCILWEVNKLMHNDTGGKGGDTTTLHDTKIQNYPIVEELAEKMRSLHKEVDGLFGWIDASFMVVDDVPYFTEWMVRMGCSNNSTLTRQMGRPLPVVLEHLEAKKHIDPEWRARFSCGVSIYTVPLCGGGEADYCVTRSLFNYFSEDDCGFDLIDAASFCGADYAIADSNTRYGIGQGYSDTSPQDAYVLAIHVARQQNVLYGAFREEPHIGMLFDHNHEFAPKLLLL